MTICPSSPNPHNPLQNAYLIFRPVLLPKLVGDFLISGRECLGEICGNFGVLFHKIIHQRVLSGGLDPWGVGSANLGRPIFAPNFPQIPLKQAFSCKLSAEMGRPKFADPTPHGSNPPLKTPR